MPTSSAHHREPRKKRVTKLTTKIRSSRNLGGLPHPKKAREAAGLSQRELAKAAGTHQAVVCRFEKAGYYPTNYLLRAAYLKALGLTEEANRAP